MPVIIRVCAEQLPCESLVKAIVYDQVDHGAEDHIRKTEIFPFSADAKNWVDANWKWFGLDECWRVLSLTRRDATARRE